MPGRLPDKRAPGPGALFLCGCLLAISASASTDCPVPGNGNESVRVVHVYDGDTLRLSDGRRLRLIGINAPETGRKDQPAQPLADRASTELQTLLELQDNTLTLLPGADRHDHYGRLLAHGFLPNGDNPAARLLERGLATALTVPPNTRAAGCYRRIEQRARAAGRGIWSLPQYRTLSAGELQTDLRGFRLVEGRVREIRQSRHSIWLQFDGPLVAHIARKDLGYFPEDQPQALLGHRVEVRGWLKPDRRSGLRVNVRHPSALDVKDAASP